MRYLRNFTPYLLGKLGKSREETYEISNLGNMNTGTGMSTEGEPAQWQIERMVFSQPANAIGCAINFNFVSTTAGGLTLTITWQKGVLGLDPKDDEQQSMEIVGSMILEFLERASNSREFANEEARQQEARAN